MNRKHADKDHMGSNKIEASRELELSKAKMRASSVFRNGRITVPIQIRRKLGLKAGDQVEFVFDEDRTIMQPVLRRKAPADDLEGEPELR